ncbi:MAG: hypothetical protein JNJ50_15855 [Acidobacteria bacterium]|nr:hypothetical protein [Acidobacteriota bacterium]
MSMRCWQCGENVQDTARWCSNCGVRVDAQAAAPSAELPDTTARLDWPQAWRQNEDAIICPIVYDEPFLPAPKPAVPEPSAPTPSPSKPLPPVAIRKSGPLPQPQRRRSAAPPVLMWGGILWPGEIPPPGEDPTRSPDYPQPRDYFFNYDDPQRRHLSVVVPLLLVAVVLLFILAYALAIR